MSPTVVPKRGQVWRRSERPEGLYVLGAFTSIGWELRSVSGMTDRTPDSYATSGRLQRDFGFVADNMSTLCSIDHEARCCADHGSHVMPHRGCILR